MKSYFADLRADVVFLKALAGILLRNPKTWGGGGGGTPYNGLYGEAPPERGTLFRLQVYKRAGSFTS